ncbi:hypothetical protein FQR65_LT09880 [Abscondita terminalis]|nr:hypothetical protein FQR65_LT09880 [Abscondita terminalis]
MIKTFPSSPSASFNDPSMNYEVTLSEPCKYLHHLPTSGAEPSGAENFSYNVTNNEHPTEIQSFARANTNHSAVHVRMGPDHGNIWKNKVGTPNTPENLFPRSRPPPKARIRKKIPRSQLTTEEANPTPKKRRCAFCKNSEHTKEECRKKKRTDEKQSPTTTQCNDATTASCLIRMWCSKCFPKSAPNVQSCTSLSATTFFLTETTSTTTEVV